MVLAQPLPRWTYVGPVLGVSAMFSYNTWLLWRPLSGQSAVFNGYLSELSASDQPNNLLFRGGDLVTGLLVLVMAFRALQVLHGRQGSPWRLVVPWGWWCSGCRRSATRSSRWTVHPP